MKIFNSLNAVVQTSPLGRFFEFDARETTFLKEIQGGTVTFLTMAYILAVNPMILADSGGSCVGDHLSVEYQSCIEDLKRQYVTATALVSMCGCILMGISTNLPIVLGCGMGLNAYFAYSVVGFQGSGNISFQTALTTALMEGCIFFVLAISGVMYTLVKWVPEPIKLATPAAMGFFLAHLGLQSAEGIGLVVSDSTTAVTLGGCPEDKRTTIVSFTEACQLDLGQCVSSGAYTCDDLGGIMTSPTTWVGILGLLIIAIFLSYRKNYAFIVGITFVTFTSWFRNTPITYFPDTIAGDAKFEYFRKIISVEPLNLLKAQFASDFSQSKEIALTVFTFLYVQFLDTSCTLLALVSSMNISTGDGTEFPKSRQAFSVTAISSIFGAVFGLSPTVIFIESIAGVEAGARTGFAAVVVGFYFLLSIFFAPIISSIPPWATGGTLIIVGALMCRGLSKIKWEDPAHAIPALCTLIIMPLTFSIANGIIAGLFIYSVLQTVFKLLSLVGISREHESLSDSTREHESLSESTREHESLSESTRKVHHIDEKAEKPEHFEESISEP